LEITDLTSYAGSISLTGSRSMLIGAFIAAVAATIADHRRDEVLGTPGRLTITTLLSSSNGSRP